MAEIERDKLFDHEYDGIREYDNPMPLWWKLLFVVSILFAYPYILYYHFGPGPSIEESLESEVQAYAGQLLATYGELKPERQTILKYMNDDLAMAGMAGLFKGKCAQCHLADGSGNVGPNLTDDHYLNVKKLTDIPDILTNGLVAKGMPAWGSKLSETEIVLLTAYVARMRRNPIPGKEPQGDPIAPWPAYVPAQADDAPAADSSE